MVYHHTIMVDHVRRMNIEILLNMEVNLPWEAVETASPWHTLVDRARMPVDEVHPTMWARCPTMEVVPSMSKKSAYCWVDWLKMYKNVGCNTNPT